MVEDKAGIMPSQAHKYMITNNLGDKPSASEEGGDRTGT
jgi:hypothetical protein